MTMLDWFSRLSDPFVDAPVVRPPERMTAILPLLPGAGAWAARGHRHRIPVQRRRRDGAPGFPRHHRRLGDRDAAGRVLLALRLGAGRDGIRHPGDPPRDRTSLARAHQHRLCAEPDGAGPLAELPLRAPPEPLLLPERFRRPDRAEGAAERPRASRERRQRRRGRLHPRHLSRRHDRPVRRAGRVADPAGGTLGRRLCRSRSTGWCRRCGRSRRRWRRPIPGSPAGSSTATPTSRR